MSDDNAPYCPSCGLDHYGKDCGVPIERNINMTDQSDKIQRYAAYGTHFNHDSGLFVTFDDHEAATAPLRKRIDELEKELAKYSQEFDLHAPSECTAECKWSYRVHGAICPQGGCLGVRK